MSITRILDFVVLSRLKTATIEGIGPDMAAARDKSLAALDEAAAEIGDKLTHLSSNEPIAAELANSFYVGVATEQRSKFVFFGKIAGSLFLAGFFLWLCAFLFEGRHWKEASLMIGGVSVFVAMIMTICTLVNFDEGLSEKDRVRRILLNDASEIWALGEKAVYSVFKDEVQVIRIDAIGSVSFKADGILIRSRFGEPTATLSRRHTKLHILEEIVSNIRSRIL